MDVTFRRCEPERDHDALVDLMSTEEWEFRLLRWMTVEEARAALAEGYGGSDDLTLVIEVDGDVVGLVRAEDMGQGNEDPRLDFRLRGRFRGLGIGTEAARHITTAVFEAYPEIFRIEAQTRRDNAAMRRVLVKAGYVMEAVYRRAWPAGEGVMLDGVGYAILRADWQTGTSTPVVWD